MDRFDRIYNFDKLLRSRRRPVSLEVIQERLECSRATAIRLIKTMRDYLGAPVTYDREQGGYFYDAQEGQNPYELPGLWFNASELYALITSLQLLARVEPGILSQHLEPLRERIESLLQNNRAGNEEILRRVKILGAAARPVDLDHFRKATESLAIRRRLSILYHGRASDETSERIISPQRLIYYKSNWYLDAWCHLRNALRSFSLDRLHPIEMLDEPATDVSDTDLDAHFTRAYGIFAGPARYTAEIRFSALAARWIADEQWHPEQQGQVHQDGSYTLKVPYNDPTELIMDILKYAAEAEVIGPSGLREIVREKLEMALVHYVGANKSPGSSDGSEAEVKKGYSRK